MRRLVFISLWVLCALTNCGGDITIEDPMDTDDPMDPIDIPKEECSGILYYNQETSNLGIPLFTGDQARNGWTEMNSQYINVRSSSEISTSMELKRSNDQSFLKFDFENLSEDEHSASIRMSAFRQIFDKVPLPDELQQAITGLSFRAAGVCKPIALIVEVRNEDNELILTEQFNLKQDTMSVHQFEFVSPNFKWMEFKIDKVHQSDTSATVEGSIAIDDVYLTNGSDESFYPPENDDDLLSWLRRASIRNFLWYYDEPQAGLGFVTETSTDYDIISLSGLGYSYAIFILAEQDGIISSAEARSKIKAMLNWQQAQNWFDGSGGWHGFPHHYFKPDGTYFWPDVSTIDWAMCAAGLRVVRQKYAGDLEMGSIVDELLARPDWGTALASEDKIAMGFDGTTGEMNPYRWALAFSEETELVYLEAVASGKLDASIFDAIVREKKEGFYPSWFGAGFTYNWLQLWTGPIEPYATNSQMAYQSDAGTCSRVFGSPLMGLTACATISEINSDGFANWNNYISNQGSDIHGASGGTSILKISPAPYGAALALPFSYNESLTALRAYIDLGFYHEYIGLPDNVRLKNLPDDVESLANWEQYDINIGPIALAIEQIRSNQIGKYYLSDPDIKVALDQLTDAFEF